MEKNWLTPELKKEIRKVFEPRYHRELTDKEICEIADNLSDVMEVILKYQWRKKYDKNILKTPLSKTTQRYS